MRPRPGRFRTAALRAAAALLAAPFAVQAGMPEWAKAVIAADSPAWHPDAKAVVLLDSVKVRFVPLPGSAAHADGAMGAHFLMRGVVRVRSEDARKTEFAFLPYDPDSTHITTASAWIAGPDGGKAKSFGRGDFIDSVAVYNTFVWDRRRVLQFVSEGKLSEGDVIAWEFEFDLTSAFSEYSRQFRQLYPSIMTELEVQPPAGMRIEFRSSEPRLRSPSTGSSEGSLRWALSREEAPPAREPNSFFANPKLVSVRCVPVDPGKAAWTWDLVSRKVAAIMEPRVDATGPAVRTEAEALLNGRSGRWDRIRALADFVQSAIVYLEITEDRDLVAGIRPHAPADVLRNRYGDCKDKATLLVSLLRSCGEEARLALVTAGNPLTVEEQWPSPNFNHAVVLIKADGSEPASWLSVDTGDGRWIAFDPTDSVTPLGVLPEGDQGGLSLVVDVGGGKLVRMPVADTATSRVMVRIEGELGTDGVLKGRISEDCSGLAAANYYARRHNKTREQYTDFIEARIHRANPLSRDVHWTDNWQPSEARYHLEVNFAVPAFGRRLPSGLILLSPDILPGTAKLEAWEKGNDGVVVFGVDSLDEEVRLTVPDGWTFEEVPPGWESHITSMAADVSFKVDGRSIVFRKNIARSPGILDRAAYGETRGLYREVHEAERGSVILKRLSEVQPPAAGTLRQ